MLGIKNLPETKCQNDPLNLITKLTIFTHCSVKILSAIAANIVTQDFQRNLDSSLLNVNSMFPKDVTIY